MRQHSPIFAALFFAVGCQTTTVPNKVESRSTGTIVNLPADRALTPDEALNGNPSAVRLTDIEGTLLEYYALHKTLPPSLEELKSLADIGTELNLTSPASGKPYLYNPVGLVLAGSPKRIIVYDPAPNAHGQRYCIFAPPLSAGSPASMEVLHLPESEFQRYFVAP